jgi:nucleolin
VNSFQSSIPSLSRSFHQSRIWRAEEQKKETEAAAQDAVSESSGTTSEPLGQSEAVSESTTTTPSSSTTSSAQDAVSESSGTTSEPVGQSEHESKPVLEQASEIAEKAKETVSDAAAKAAQAVGEFTQQPKERAQDAAASTYEQASETASKVSEQASEYASKANEQVSEATSQISEQAQYAAGQATRAARNTADSAKAGAAYADRRFNKEDRPPVAPAKILYVGNLFFEVTAPQLEAEFAKFGEVTNSRVVTDDRGLSKGFAYIEFADQQQADAAREALDQKSFQGRRLSVQYHKRRDANANSNIRKNLRGPAQPSKTLFIGNMSYQMSDRDLNGKKSR